MKYEEFVWQKLQIVHLSYVQTVVLEQWWTMVSSSEQLLDIG